MQRQLTQDAKYGAPNHDDAAFTDINARWIAACQRGTATGADGNPSIIDTQTGEPILVSAEFLRVGQISGVVIDGFLEADIVFIDEETRRVINSLTSTVAVPLVGKTLKLENGVLVDDADYDMTAEAQRLADGTATGADIEKVHGIVLYSRQAWNLGV